MVRIRTQPKSMHFCLQRRRNQKCSTFMLSCSRRKILISTSTTWRSSTACRQPCHSWRRKPKRSFCRVWKRSGTTTPLRRWGAFVWVCMAPSMAFWRVAPTTSATVEVVKLTVRAKNYAISTIKSCLGNL